MHTQLGTVCGCCCQPGSRFVAALGVHRCLLAVSAEPVSEEGMASPVNVQDLQWPCCPARSVMCSSAALLNPGYLRSPHATCNSNSCKHLFLRPTAMQPSATSGSGNLPFICWPTLTVAPSRPLMCRHGALASTSLCPTAVRHEVSVHARKQAVYPSSQICTNVGTQLDRVVCLCASRPTVLLCCYATCFLQMIEQRNNIAGAEPCSCALLSLLACCCGLACMTGSIQPRLLLSTCKLSLPKQWGTCTTAGT